MKDNLISNQTKQIGLICSFIFKVMNFLIFWDFFGVFINFYEFLWILFQFLKIKNNDVIVR